MVLLVYTEEAFLNFSKHLSGRKKQKTISIGRIVLLVKFAFGSKRGNLFIEHKFWLKCNKLTSVFYVCPLIDDDCRHSIVKIAVDPSKKNWILFSLTESLSITFLALSLVNNKIQEISLAEQLTVWRHVGARNFYLSVLLLTIKLTNHRARNCYCKI